MEVPIFDTWINADLFCPPAMKISEIQPEAISPQNESDEFPFGNSYLECSNLRQKQLLEALLRRGFLMHPHGQKIRFDQLPEASDKAYLKTVVGTLPEGSPLQGASVAIYTETDQWFIEIPTEGEGFSALLGRLAASQPVRHINGSHCFFGAEYSAFYQRWREFASLRFGPKVPVNALDPGVALMVKVLPWYGVATILCCEGHPEQNNPECWSSPYIGLLGEHHTRWCRMLLDRLVSSLGSEVPDGLVQSVFRPAIVNEGRFGWGGGMTGEGRRLSHDEHQLWLNSLFRLAVRLIDPDMAAKARAEKSTLTWGI